MPPLTGLDFFGITIPQVETWGYSYVVATRLKYKVVRILDLDSHFPTSRDKLRGDDKIQLPARLFEFASETQVSRTTEIADIPTMRLFCMV